MKRALRSLRMPMTAFLALLLLFDGVLAYRVWWYDFPNRRPILEDLGSGTVRVVGFEPRWVFTPLDGLLLGLLAAVHVGLVYAVWRSWKTDRATPEA
jgi:hypothetical protein